MIWATIGGVTVGMAAALWYLVRTWWPGLKRLKSKPLDHAANLIPFLFGWAYGALGVLSVAGLIGMAFDWGLWAMNWLGDVALFLGVGADAGMSSRGQYLPLTTTGSATVFLITVVWAAISGSSAVRYGTLSGAGMGTSAVVAGLAAVHLAQGANWLGDTVYGAIL